MQTHTRMRTHTHIDHANVRQRVATLDSTPHVSRDNSYILSSLDDTCHTQHLTFPTQTILLLHTLQLERPLLVGTHMPQPHPSPSNAPNRLHFTTSAAATHVTSRSTPAMARQLKVTREAQQRRHREAWGLHAARPCTGHT